ncbi:MAG: hypothetical protein KC912_09880 [Proteobacteria bacterium]|nr:hypothetical protein [Pseudomonadota bacterium]
MSQIDDLFEGEDAVKPNVAFISTLLVVGLLLSILGLACSSVPGGILVLLAFHYADVELDRVESGYLPETERPRVRRLRSFALAGVVLLTLVIIQQIWLTSMGFYDVFWEASLRTLFGTTEAVS